MSRTSNQTLPTVSVQSCRHDQRGAGNHPSRRLAPAEQRRSLLPRRPAPNMVMPRARKGQDLRRDPRVAVHSIPWDSRKLRDGAADVGEADAKVSGTAVLVSDAGALSAFRAWLKSERGV